MDEQEESLLKIIEACRYEDEIEEHSQMRTNESSPKAKRKTVCSHPPMIPRIISYDRALLPENTKCRKRQRVSKSISTSMAETTTAAATVAAAAEAANKAADDDQDSTLD